MQNAGEKLVQQSTQYHHKESALTCTTELSPWAEQNPPWVPDVADGEGGANLSWAELTA